MTGRMAAWAAVGLWMLAGAAAVPAEEPAVDAAEAAAPEAGLPADELCATVEEAIRLLEENQMMFSNGAARQAVLEAVIRASEPTVLFLDDEAAAARARRLTERAWDTGLMVVAADGLPRIAAVREDSPAAEAEILPGELIEKIGGRELLSSTPLNMVRTWLAEGEDAALEIGVRADDETSRTVTLARKPSTESALTDVEELPADMGYIRVEGLFPGAGEDIAGVLEKWQTEPVFGAILDLRGVGGAGEAEIPAVAARFAPVGPVLYTLSDRQGREISSVAAGPAPEAMMPLMVLVDEDTHGAAERLAAVLAGSVKGAMIIGRPTAGDPLLREPRRLSTGQYALLATRQLRTADGEVYAGRTGVVPDVLIADAALNETVYEPDMPVLSRGKKMSDEEKEDKALRDRTRNDTYLRRATDVLLGLKALGYDR